MGHSFFYCRKVLSEDFSWSVAMDPSEMLAVRFHLLGEFVNEGRNL